MLNESETDWLSPTVSRLTVMVQHITSDHAREHTHTHTHTHTRTLECQ